MWTKKTVVIFVVRPKNNHVYTAVYWYCFAVYCLTTTVSFPEMTIKHKDGGEERETKGKR